MKLSEELKKAIISYRKTTPWYGQWPLYKYTFFSVIGFAFIIALAAALGMTIAAVIAMLCTDGTMPTWLQFLCY